MNKYYAVSDLHGNYELFKKIVDFIDDNDVVYVLGDATDRGQNGIKIIEDIIGDSRFKYIKGNHDLMFENVVKKYVEYEANDIPNEIIWEDDFSIWTYNGGKPTFNAWKHSKNKYKILRWLHDLPLYDVITNHSGNTVILSHSGAPIDVRMSESDRVWDRKNITDRNCVMDDNTYHVHGHTPIRYAMEDLDHAHIPHDNMMQTLKYCNGHKFDIDCGTQFSHTCILLDLDTFEEHIFREEDEHDLDIVYRV